jgi:hypothetical protein
MTEFFTVEVELEAHALHAASALVLIIVMLFSSNVLDVHVDTMSP